MHLRAPPVRQPEACRPGRRRRRRRRRPRRSRGELPLPLYQWTAGRARTPSVAASWVFPGQSAAAGLATTAATCRGSLRDRPVATRRARGVPTQDRWSRESQATPPRIPNCLGARSWQVSAPDVPGSRRPPTKVGRSRDPTGPPSHLTEPSHRTSLGPALATPTVPVDPKPPRPKDPPEPPSDPARDTFRCSPDIRPFSAPQRRRDRAGAD